MNSNDPIIIGNEPATQQLDSTDPARDLDRELKELEVRNKEVELEIRKREALNSRVNAILWHSPIALAVLTAFVGYIGTLISWNLSRTDGKVQHDRTLALEEIKQRSLEKLEKDKLQGALILDAMRTGEKADKSKQAAANLLLLADAKLITLDESTLGKLRQRAGDVGPGLPSSSPVPELDNRSDDSVLASSIDPNHALRSASRSVGYLRSADQRGNAGTAFLVGKDLAITMDFVIDGSQQYELTLDDESAPRSYRVKFPPLISEPQGFALIRINGDPGSKHGWLKLASDAPKVLQKICSLQTRGSAQQLAVLNVANCRVESVYENEFTHGCSTAPGAAGGPLLTEDGKQVLGIHYATFRNKRSALRSDLIAKKIQKILADY